MEKLEHIKTKIFREYTGLELSRLLEFWKFKSKKVVFTNGCFDIIHRGHIEYLAKAADEGDVLIIGLNTDSSVKKLKGPSRPVQDQESRALILASFQFVGAVVLFDEDTPYNLIKTILPNVLIKGADYSIENIVGADIVMENGGEVKTIEFVDGYSSSTILNKIQSK